MPLRLLRGNDVQGRERDPITSPRQQTAFITEVAPKKGTLSSVSSALTYPNGDLGDPCYFPNPVDIPDELCSNPDASRLWHKYATLIAFSGTCAFSQRKHAITTLGRSNPFWYLWPLRPITLQASGVANQPKHRRPVPCDPISPKHYDTLATKKHLSHLLVKPHTPKPIERSRRILTRSTYIYRHDTMSNLNKQ